MYYDDEARRFNFVSGLLFGAVLGAGLALLSPPPEQIRSLGGRSRSAGRGIAKRISKKRGRKRLDRLRDEVADSVSEMVTTGRNYLRR